MAASLDEMAWQDFQQKKHALDNNQILKATDLDNMQPAIPEPPKDDSSGLRWAKSFPYGDEQNEGDQWGMDADETASHRVDPNWPSEYLEEKKDDQYPQYPPDPVPGSEPIERTLSQFADEREESEEEGNALSRGFNDIVNEVARLSRFVQKYERRKERRIQREQELSVVGSSIGRSFDSASGFSNENHNPLDIDGPPQLDSWDSLSRPQDDPSQQNRGFEVQDDMPKGKPHTHSSYVTNMRNVTGSARYILGFCYNVIVRMNFFEKLQVPQRYILHSDTKREESFEWLWLLQTFFTRDPEPFKN